MPRIALPALLILAGSLGFELAYGVSVVDALLYVGYELGFVVVPGWLAYRALSGEPGGPLRQLAIGWALGYVLEILAFMLTAATGTRSLLVVYPLVVAIVAGAVILRRGAVESAAKEPSRPSAISGWLIAGVCLLAVAYIGLSYFPTAPLPGARSFSYFPDYPRWISLAAEAKHHWPITDPSVAGEPLPYHYFINIHLAAVSQVTGLGLPLVYFRLFIFPLVVLSVLLFVVAGQSFARSAAVGLIAASIAFFVGELRLDASDGFVAHTPFFGLFFTLLYRSPSFLLGLVLLLPLMILIGERLRAGAERASIGGWLLIALLMVGASDAKITILPLLIAALAVFAAWTLLRSRRLPRAVWVAGGIAALVSGTVWALQYSGHSSGLQLDPFADVDSMPAVIFIKGDLASHLAGFPGRDALLDVGGVLLGVAGLLAAPLVGIAWIIRRRGLRLDEGRAWLLSILLAGLALTFAFAERGTQSGMYFLFYGIVAGYLLSAEGLRIAWRSRPSMTGRWARMAALGGAFALLVAGLIWLPPAADLFSGSRTIPLTYMLRYGGLLVALVLLYAAARRWVGPSRWGAAALISAALLAVGALATPFDSLRPAIADPSGEGRPGVGKPMSPGVADALGWIREETPTDAVLAVNNQWFDLGDATPLAFDYSAFAERRVFLEGWGYSQRTRDAGFTANANAANPFADRFELNHAAFTNGDVDALRTMAEDYGVTYLVVDVARGYPADLEALERSASVVYSDPAAVVLELDM